MRFGKIQNFLRRPGRRQFLQNPGGKSVLFDAGHQLAVRKSTGAALSELYVGFRIQMPGLPKKLNVFPTLGHCFAPLQQNRPQPCFRQRQTGKHSCRTGSGNHRTQSPGKRFWRKGQRSGFLNLHNVFPGQNRGNVILVAENLHIQRINKLYIAFISRIDRFFGYFQAFNAFRFKPRLHGNDFFQPGCIYVQIGLNIINPYHFSAFCRLIG